MPHFAESYIKSKCDHCCNNATFSRPWKKFINPMSLKNICENVMKENLSCDNVFDALFYAKASNLWQLREKAKDFIWVKGADSSCWAVFYVLLCRTACANSMHQ